MWGCMCLDEWGVWDMWLGCGAYRSVGCVKGCGYMCGYVWVWDVCGDVGNVYPIELWGIFVGKVWWVVHMMEWGMWGHCGVCVYWGGYDGGFGCKCGGVGAACGYGVVCGWSVRCFWDSTGCVRE